MWTCIKHEGQGRVWCQGFVARASTVGYFLVSLRRGDEHPNETCSRLLPAARCPCAHIMLRTACADVHCESVLMPPGCRKRPGWFCMQQTLPWPPPLQKAHARTVDSHASLQAGPMIASRRYSSSNFVSATRPCDAEHAESRQTNSTFLSPRSDASCAFPELHAVPRTACMAGTYRVDA